MRLTAKPLLLFLVTILFPGVGLATNTCVWDYSLADTMALTADCTTDSTIYVPDGWTLDGAGFTITAVDPSGGAFLGAVIKNSGSTAHVKNLTVTTSNLANVCHAGGVPDNRLRGVLFEGASGSILHTTIFNLNQGASGCQEGNAVEVRNAPFDGTHLNTKTVEIAHNQLSSWQKTGIVCNGDVSCHVHHNTIGPSATQANLAANSIQFGFGSYGTIEDNHIAGNSWPTYWVATAVLILETGGDVVIRHNNLMEGNADVGIYIDNLLGSVLVDNNRVFETGPDGSYDYGIGAWGINNTITNNKVRGYQIAYDGVSGGNNKTIPSPNDK